MCEKTEQICEGQGDAHYRRRMGRVGVRAAGVQDQFKSFLAEASPNVFLIHQEMQRGSTCAEAMDFICGEGSFDQLAKEIWTACRARVAA